MEPRPWFRQLRFAGHLLFPAARGRSSETCDCVLGVGEGRPGLTCCSAIDIRFNAALSLYLFVQFGLIQITLILLWICSPSKIHTCVEGSGPIKTSYFLGQPMGFACLAKLLGIGTARLRRNTSLTPDMRYGKDKKGSTSHTFSIDAFFTTLHESVAETLPDRPLAFEGIWRGSSLS